MGDFLSRLVARSTGASAPVMPRPRSAYEPVANPLQDAARGDADDADDVAVRPMTVASPAVRAAATAEPYRGPLHASPMAARPAPSAGLTGAALPQVTGALQSHIADAHGHLQHDSAQAPVMNTALQPAAGRAHGALLLAGGGNAGAASESQHALRGAPFTPAAAHVADRAAGAAAHARSTADANGRDAQPRNVPPAVVRRPEPVMPRPGVHADGAAGASPGAGHHTESSLRDDAAPIIQVSIGRIEVRAVSEPARAPAARRVPPRALLTLDEYVRQRMKGER